MCKLTYLAAGFHNSLKDMHICANLGIIDMLRPAVRELVCKICICLKLGGTHRYQELFF